MTLWRVGDEHKERIDHVRRPPLPWRDAAVTECGLPAEGHPTISRDELVDRVKKMGITRASMTLCMTCTDTAQRHPSWVQDPVMCIAREVAWNRRDGVFRRELLAIAALVSRHREEFAELLKDQEEIVPLHKRRPRSRRVP